MLRACFAATAGVALAACGTAPAPPGSPQPPDAVMPPSPAAESPLPVVATFSVVGDIVANVGGAHVAVHTLVGPGSDTHTFEPTPADGMALAAARLVFENGLGLEPWLDDLYAASGTTARRVVLTEVVMPIRLDEPGHAEEAPPSQDPADEPAEDHAGEPADGHAHGSFDPHVWHDPTNVARMTEAVRDALAAADPARAAEYAESAEAYSQELAALDAWIADQAASLPPARRKLVTGHGTFAYFAQRYGFEVVGTALGAATTEAGDPSAAELARLVDAIRAAGIPAIFAENVQNPDLIERIADEAGVAVGPPLYSDALGPPGSDGETYVGMMRANVAAIVSALAP